MVLLLEVLAVCAPQLEQRNTFERCSEWFTAFEVNDGLGYKVCIYSLRWSNMRAVLIQSARKLTVSSEGGVARRRRCYTRVENHLRLLFTAHHAKKALN